MILKGTAIRNRQRAVNLANHLLKANDNDICEVIDIDGHARPDDLRAALTDYYDMVNLTKGDTGLFMVSINPEVGEKMTPEFYQESIDRLEELFDMKGLPKAIVRHHKEDREHYHVVWQTTNTDTKQIQAQIYRFNVKCKNLSRELERDFGHRIVNSEKSKSAYNEKERNQATRNGSELKPDQRKKLIQQLYSQAKNRDDFSRELQQNGFTLAKGKVGICLVDEASGQVYNLEKELGKKVSQQQLNDFVQTSKAPLPDAAKLSASKQIEVKQKTKQKKSKANDNKREPKYRLKEGGIAQELETATSTAKQAGKNLDDIVNAPPESAEQKAKDFAQEREQITSDPKEEFKRKLREAQENMQRDNDNDLSQEKKNDIWKKFKDNGLDIVLWPLVMLTRLLGDIFSVLFKL